MARTHTNMQPPSSLHQGHLLEEATIHDLAAPVRRRVLGAYYTPSTVAAYIANWAIRGDGEHLLEPSFGDGTFLRAINDVLTRQNLTQTRLWGVEIDEEVRAQAIAQGLIAENMSLGADFLQIAPFPVTAIVGNPPYVRLRHVTQGGREQALRIASAALGHAMDPAGSLWMPFVLHALRFLQSGGRLAFVLPYEVTYVRYAYPLWEQLRHHFGELCVLRTHERLFPQLSQDVVIVLADGYGAQTDVVQYQAFDNVADLFRAQPIIDRAVPISAITSGARPFVNALLGTELRELLEGQIARATQPAKNMVTFNIGYVTGDKDFFHPTPAEVAAYDIRPEHLVPTVASSRALKNAGVLTSGTTNKDQLFLPRSAHLSDGERGYLAMGMQRGVHTRYKCRIRSPWYIVPAIRIPDVLLSVFHETPALVINDAQYLASNSLLCGYCTRATREELATRWYTSLTLLQCELNVHSLGGGIMIMVPREASAIRLPTMVQKDMAHLTHIDSLLKAGKLKEAYHAGDNMVLLQQMRLRPADLALIEQGIATLQHWRTAGRSSRLSVTS